VQSSYGDVKAEDIGPHLRVASSSGNVVVNKVKGPAEIETSYGDVSIESVSGPVQAASTSGGVTLHRIGGAATVRASYGAVRASAIAGPLKVSGSSSEVAAEDVAGSVDVETTYGGVSLRRVSGAVTLRLQSGSATVNELRGAALRASHRISTTYGDIDFGWPRASALGFHLESTDSSVRSDFPGQPQEVGSRRILEGTAGAAGGAQVSLTAQSGGVRLRAE